MRVIVLSSLLMGLWAQQGITQTPAPVRWSLGSVPTVSIGANGQDTLILGATSATRLANGEVVVASSKNARILWFDNKGHLLRAFGRRGRGPGEFGSDIHLSRLPGDTIVVYDGNNRRTTYVTSTGSVARIDQGGDTRRLAWMYDRTLLEHLPSTTSLGQLQATLSLISPAKSDTIRLGRVTAEGYVWLRNSPASNVYNIFAPTGAAAGAISLPDRFDPLEISGTTVLGRWLDHDDVEHIETRVLTPPKPMSRLPAPAGGVRAYDQEAELERHRSLVGTMRGVLRNVLTANEAYYSSNRRYATKVSDLGLPQSILSTGVRAVFVWADGQFYAAQASHPSTPITCVIVLSPNPTVTGDIVCG